MSAWLVHGRLWPAGGSRTEVPPGPGRAWPGDGSRTEVPPGLRSFVAPGRQPRGSYAWSAVVFDPRVPAVRFNAPADYGRAWPAGASGAEAPPGPGSFVARGRQPYGSSAWSVIVVGPRRKSISPDRGSAGATRDSNGPVARRPSHGSHRQRGEASWRDLGRCRAKSR